MQTDVTSSAPSAAERSQASRFSSAIACIVGTPPPGTSTANGAGTSSNVWLGAIRSGVSVARGSLVAPTTTVR